MRVTGWYVVRTEPNAEYQAAADLTREGYEILFPTIKSPRNRMGRADAPMFPGYLFLHYCPELMEWPSFRPANRIIGWLQFGDEIPAVPDSVINELSQRIAGIDPATGLWRRFSRGQTVKVNAGQLQGIGHVLEEARTPNARSLVLLDFMGRTVKAKIPWSDLSPIDHAPVELNKTPRRTRGQGRWLKGFAPSI